MAFPGTSTSMIMQQISTPPTGPRGRTGARNSNTAQISSRGAIQKRRANPPRVDKDGDLNMDSSNISGTKDRGGRGRRRGAASDRSDNDGGKARNGVRNSPPRGLFSGAALQKAIARGMASGEANIKGPNRMLKMEGVVKEVTGSENRRDRQNASEQIRVVGLKQSKAASNPDGGVKDLLAFLERKANGLATSGKVPVRIRKSRPEGDSMIISVTSEDAKRVLGLDGYTFAGTQLQISKYDGPSNGREGRDGQLSQGAVETRQRLTDALLRRYDPITKLLDLSALGNDAGLAQMGIIDRSSTISKLFAALMVICNEKFSNAQQKQEAIMSVSLANNGLRNVSLVTSLAQTFPDLKNLDLSNNKFENMSALGAWRWRFRKLDHLVLSGNAIEKVEPNYKETVLRWYPSLRMLNGVQIRSDQEVAAVLAGAAEAAKGKIPIPVRPALFLDEGQVAENFLKQFLPAYDNDRTSLVSQFYDDQSTFSLNVNASAPRAHQNSNNQTGTDDMKKQMWDPYIKKSRNLMKVSYLTARMSRTHTGITGIQQCWTSLPPTRHPDLFGEPHKWLIECHSLPGLPDPTGQSPSGVGGLIVTVHGEFDELVKNNNTNSSNAASTLPTIKRSFDRTFILGPGLGPTGIRVINDLLTLRAYGGSEAWMSEEAAAELKMTDTLPPSISSRLEIPAGLGQAIDGKSETQVQKEQMIIEMSKRTGMTLEYSNLCLEEKAYVFEEALMAFENVKVSYNPSEHFPPSRLD
ncbi:MAG: nuclear mRNA export, poly(A)+RNA binding protein [Peltula sp. TS41687]|nr:MAG: nuclear mRNA export, poly(A)+RNA binding protein [Peltula sp. TS41687]